MYKLTVPLEAQRKNSTCWHAAALMVWNYSLMKSGRAGPMHSLNGNWIENQAISPVEFVSLAINVGLVGVPGCNGVPHSASSLEEWLKNWGPIWCAGYWYGPGHIIVLTGVDSEVVHFNDPDGGKAKCEGLSWFNAKLASQIANCMMAKDPTRY